MLTLLAALALCAQDPRQEGPLRDIDDLRREIELLRTITKLDLTRDQIQKIIKLSDEAKKKNAEIVANSKDDLAELKSALEEMRDSAAKGEAPSRDQEEKIGELQRAVGEVMKGTQEVNEKFASDLKEVFDEKQLKAITALGRPDPLRGMREGLSRMLEHLKDNPDADPSEMIRNQLTHMGKHLGLSESDIDGEVERIVKLLKEAAEAKDPEAKLLEITEQGKLGEAAKKMMPPHRDDGGHQLAQTFLDARTIKALKKRLEHMK